MRRRDFLGVLSGAAVAWPLTGRAQQQSMPTIGYLGAGTLEASRDSVAAINGGLSEVGYVEGRNLAIEYRLAEGHYDRLPAMAAELVGRRVSTILATSLPAVLAAKAASASIPIVFVIGADPVAFGVVPSLNRPDGNVTGVSQFFGALGAKRLELLHELAPTATKIAVLSNRNNPNSENHLNDVREAARVIGLKIDIAIAGTEAEIEAAFETFVREQADALLVADDPFFSVRRDQIVALAAEHKLPTIYFAREFAAAGGLIGYGSSGRENYRQAGVYVGRILKGAKTSDLPVLQPTKFEMVLSLKTAKVLGLKIPQSLVLRADEVIE
jgi:putative ABC transport system substrate-binding protein